MRGPNRQESYLDGGATAVKSSPLQLQHLPLSSLQPLSVRHLTPGSYLWLVYRPTPRAAFVDTTVVCSFDAVHDFVVCEIVMGGWNMQVASSYVAAPSSVIGQPIPLLYLQSSLRT